MRELARHGIPSRPYFTPIHLQPFYRDQFGFREGDYPITERMAKRVLALPFYTAMPEEQVEYVCQTLRRILDAA
jgi:perosamine synthetase